jgi:light-regulated signal transduction histidine kinase (bacteriophytochrome)
VEDSSSDVELMVRELGLGGFEVSYNVAQSEAEFRALVRANSYAIVLADFSLPQWRGLEALRVLADEELDTPLILVSGTVGDLSAVECIKQGVSDYILKDRLARLPAAVRGALEEQRLRQERKCAQDDLAQKAHELARSNQELEQFAYVASHDLQEPLRMVAAYTELLAERYQGKLDAQADKYIHYAVDGARRMQTLIQDLLAFSRVGRQEMELSVVNFENVVDLAIANLQTAIVENKVVIKREALPSLAAVQSLMVQVFQNLISNAIKFRSSSTPCIEVKAEKSSGGWMFSVADNGIGMAPGYCEEIFVIFKRLHTQQEYTGNGIGLALCRKIIEWQGGKIWVTSEPGKGSIFRFTLPGATTG